MYATKPGGFMLSTVELIKRAKARAGDVTDYRLAKMLDVPPSTVCNYQKGRSLPANPIAMRLAEIAGVDPVEALASVNIERATTAEDRAAWELILSRCAH